jgi:hypothetical protein
VTDPDRILAERCAELQHNPLGWVRQFYGWGEPGILEHEPGPEQWQADLLGHIGRELAAGRSPVRVAVSSGHGTGKSTLMAMVRGWAMSTMAGTKGVVTANTFNQLRTKTLPEFAKWHHLQLNAHWFRGTDAYRYALQPELADNWRFDAIPWSADNPAAFAGLHNHGRRIVLLYDEASEIADVIWEVSEGALTDANTEILWLCFGNPTQASGRFRECWGRFRHAWHTLEIDSRAVRRTNKALIAQWIEAYGEDSDFVRVRVKGQPPRVGSMALIGHDLVEQAMARTPAPSIGDPLVFGVDVGRFGDDASVIYRRRGHDGRSWPPLKFRGLDTMQLAARVVAQAEEDKPDAIFIDETGVGAGVVDRVRQLMANSGTTVLGVNFGAASDRAGLMAVGAADERYANKRAEMWGAVREWLRKGGCIPNDPELRDDLTGVQYGFNARMEIQLERKEDMKRRGLASPDVGDALAVSLAYPVLGSRLKAQAQRLNAAGRQAWDYDPHAAA